MADVVVQVALEDDSVASRLHTALDAFAKWRFELSEQDDQPYDAPDIMIKTIATGPDGVEKALIFQDRTTAADFLSFWRREQRR